MCRWAAYLGSELYLEDIITSPCHSLIAQSHRAHEAKTATNGDGFGVAWYGNHQEPGLYRDLLPAWSDQNLKSLARQIHSRLFLAHVRASTGGETSRANCHPFVHQRWSFMHNGQIGSFEHLRRKLEALLPDELYAHKHGSTDSELMFLLMLHLGLDHDPMQALTRMVETVRDVAVSAGVVPFIRLTAAFSDGATLYAVRYASDIYAPTLYTAKWPIPPVSAWYPSRWMVWLPIGWLCRAIALSLSISPIISRSSRLWMISRYSFVRRRADHF